MVKAVWLGLLSLIFVGCETHHSLTLGLLVPSFLAVLVLLLRSHHASKAHGRRESEYRLLVELQTDLIVKVDAGGRFLFVSPSYCQLFGKPERELLGQRFMPLVHPEDQPLTQASIDSLARPPHSSYHEQRAMTQAGWRWLGWSNHALLDERDQLVGITAVGRDITERREAEIALTRREEMYRRVFDTASDGLLLFDERGRLADANPAACQQLGQSREALLSDPRASPRATLLLGPLEDIVLSDAFSVTAATESSFSGEVKVEGRELEVQVVVYTPSPEGQHRLVSVRDLTEVRALEETRRQLDLQLQQASKLESLGVLAGGIAHEFNNLLVGVLGRAELAGLALPPNTAAQQHLAALKRAAERATELTQQMLAFSGRGPFSLTPLGLDPLVREACAYLEGALKGAKLSLELGTEGVNVLGDAGQLTQVVVNLVNNAVDAQASSLTLRTSAQWVDQARLTRSVAGDGLSEGRYLCLEVEDNGAGFPADLEARLFDPFFSTKFTGRGLGLPAVLGIVRGHQGTIEVASAPGRGSRFTVLFPIHADVAQIAPSPRSQAEPPAGPPCVLVVDDELSVREVCTFFLEYEGFKVLTAEDGVEALAVLAARKSPVSLIILDMTMPRMDGRQTLQALSERHPDVPVILCSGYDEGDPDGGFGLGVQGFLKKPFTQKLLLEKVGEVLG